MLQSEVFIFKLVSIDRFASSAIVVSKITTLAHEVWNDTVENASLVAKTFLSGAQSTEIFSCLGDNIAAKLKI